MTDTRAEMITKNYETKSVKQEIPREILDRVIAEVTPYTMAPPDALTTTIHMAINVCENNIPGMIIECGTWRGGSSFAMLLAQRYLYGEIRKKVLMFDSFRGMGQPVEQDGEMARTWAAKVKEHPNHPAHFNNCSASIDEVVDAAEKLVLLPFVELVPGWFEDTVSKFDSPIIALLRIDCDWYSPCMTVYEKFTPYVSPNGIIIIDDYYVWPGCARATHEYLGKHSLSYRIRPAINQCGAYMIKESDNG